MGRTAQTLARASPSPEVPVECPGLWSAPQDGGCLILQPHSRIRGVGRGWAGGGAGKRTIRQQPRRAGYRQAMADVPGAQRAVPGGPEPRDPLDCWACAVLVTAQNLLVAAFNLLLLALVLGTILLPAVTMLGFGFLCHSQFLRSQAPPCTAHLRDPGFTALLVTGFLLLVPLLVLALASYRRLCLRLRLADCLVPYSRALYRRRRTSQPRQTRASPGSQALPTSGKVWV
nr:transmembrane protein 88 [Callithrix jacchus]